MARRTQAELITEIGRLAQCHAAIIDCLNAHAGDGWDYHGPGVTLPVESYIADIEAGRITASQALGAWRETLNELAFAVAEMVTDGAGSASPALVAYRVRTGRVFWEDAGHPKKLIAAMLKRGRIDDEADYYLIRNAIDDGNASLLTDRQRQKAQALLAAYEELAVGRDGRM
ncbi:MAG: hypothetical protein AAF914_12485 [Pseudomonadota bacterium]